MFPKIILTFLYFFLLNDHYYYNYFGLKNPENHNISKSRCSSSY
jgi:hypothetical protein